MVYGLVTLKDPSMDAVEDSVVTDAIRAWPATTEKDCEDQVSVTLPKASTVSV